MSTRSINSLHALTAGLIACTLVACGGSSKLTKAQLVSKANAACATYANEIRTVGPLPTDFKTDATVASRYLDQLKPPVTKFKATVDRLVPPDSLKSAWGQFVSLIDSSAQSLNTATQKAHAKDSSGIADFDRANSNGPAIRAAASQLGLTACSSH
jgi:hypothetical protein